MPKRNHQNEDGDLLNRLKSLPRSSRSNPFDCLSDEHKEEWEGVRSAWAAGKLSHVSISQLNRSVCSHFGMKQLSFAKFRKELERKAGA